LQWLCPDGHRGKDASSSSLGGLLPTRRPPVNEQFLPAPLSIEAARLLESAQKSSFVKNAISVRFRAFIRRMMLRTCTFTVHSAMLSL